MRICLVCLVMALACAAFAADVDRRAPLGFQGMRGKKSLVAADTVYPEIQEAPFPKRAPSSDFVGMRGKKLLTEEPSGMFKRAPSGFMGMRGKKDMEMLNFGEGYEKRAPMGFMGMRGKKDDYLDQEFNPDKRAPMGFMGMRGKKEYDSDMFGEDKRAPANGFFGMRGKKQPARSSFFGMRGKKYPYEFRGKFVGVRGKKTMSDEGYFHENELEGMDDVPSDLDLNQLMMYLTEDENGLQMEKRKGPQGFLGMRG